MSSTDEPFLELLESIEININKIEDDFESLLPEGEIQESPALMNLVTSIVGGVGYAAANSGVPFVTLAGKLIESIVEAANEHCAQLVRLKRHVVNARIAAKCADECIENLKKKIFSSDSACLYFFLIALKKLEKLVRGWIAKSPREQKLSLIHI